MRRSTISCPALHRREDTAASAPIVPRTPAWISASTKSIPDVRACSRQTSQRHENDVADGDNQTVVCVMPPPASCGRRQVCELCVALLERKLLGAGGAVPVLRQDQLRDAGRFRVLRV